jgi:formylglycine-generating enzyme required for sulfatase activity
MTVRIEKTVFISYRRADVYTALAVYENLKNQGYDVFFDYRSISAGDFEQIITSNIKARAHFILILTPTALNRCNEPGDWLRREIETAIDEKRNIIPLFFKGFQFGKPTGSGIFRWFRGLSSSASRVLTGKLKDLSRYNGMNVHEDFFDEAMYRLRTQYLNVPLETVLHPVSTEVRKVVQEEQFAADKALEKIEDVKELLKPVRDDSRRLKWRPYGVAASILFLVVAGLAGINAWIRQSDGNPTPPATNQVVANTRTLDAPLNTATAALKTSIPTRVPTRAATPAPTRGVGSTMVSTKDRMTLVYVPAGQFTMGSANFRADEQPVHSVYLDSYWIDQTEVTNEMYALCVSAGSCNEPLNKTSQYMSDYYGNSAFENHPVIWVDWNKAKTYCEWAGRRLPTESEWEKAARGTDGRTYPWGEESPIGPGLYLLNYSHTSGDTEAVGGYPDGASPYGALDMAGNVWEWVNDWYSETYYTNSPTSNPPGPDSGQYHVLRGGSWKLGYPMNYHLVRSAYRNWDNPSNSFYTIGFRCAMDATP